MIALDAGVSHMCLSNSTRSQALSPLCRSGCLCLSSKSLSVGALSPPTGRSRAAPGHHVFRYLACGVGGEEGGEAVPQGHRFPLTHRMCLGAHTWAVTLTPWQVCPFLCWPSKQCTPFPALCASLPYGIFLVPSAPSSHLNWCAPFTGEPKVWRTRLVQCFVLSLPAKLFSRPYPPDRRIPLVSMPSYINSGFSRLF